MSNSFSLITKNAYAVEYISKYFITQDIGSKILTISEFTEQVSVARGTIQNSLKILSDANAITIKSHGQLGSYLKEKNTKLLLKFAGINFLIGVMPLPYSKIYEGLSTALLHTIENKLNIPVNMAYMRGAEKRIEMILNQRYDFAIVSKFAALKYLEDHDDIKIVKEFKTGSFLSGHSLMFSDSNNFEIKDGMKIGIDYDSIDQAYLTKEVCKNNKVEFVEVSYTQLLEKLRLKEIDATVWNGDEIDKYLESGHAVKLNLKDNDNTRAVVIIDKNRIELNTIIFDIIDNKQVEDIQLKVIEGTITPSY